MSSPRDDRAASFRADRDPSVYARRRAKGRRRRMVHDGAFDPSPPAETDWVVADRSQVRRVPRGPETLGDVLDEVIASRRWGERIRGAQVFDRWAEVVGKDLARHCAPVRLAGGVLTVSAESPSWATQLRYLTATLALNVNTELGEPLVTQVHVVVARGG